MCNIGSDMLTSKTVMMNAILSVIFVGMYAYSAIEASILPSSGGLQKRAAPSCGNILWPRGIPSDGKSPDLGEFPWLALLEYKTNRTSNNATEDGEASAREILCGGVLISDRHVLTAAHCLRPTLELIGVRLGEHDTATEKDCLSDGDQTWCSEDVVVAGVEKATPHEAYKFDPEQADNETQLNDVGIIRLDRSIYTDYIQPICLPSEEVAQRKKYLSAGWGAVPESTHPVGNLKLMTRATGLDKKACDELYGSQLKADVVCASTKMNLTSCTADSGGPLMTPDRSSKMMVVGIFAPTGDNFCQKEGVPGTYIDVFKHLDWINSHIQE